MRSERVNELKGVNKVAFSSSKLHNSWMKIVYLLLFLFSLLSSLAPPPSPQNVLHEESERERNFFHSLLVYFSPWTFFSFFSSSSSFSLAVWVLRVFAYKKYTQLRKRKKISEFCSHFEGKSFIWGKMPVI